MLQRGDVLLRLKLGKLEAFGAKLAFLVSISGFISLAPEGGKLLADDGAG